MIYDQCHIKLVEAFIYGLRLTSIALNTNMKSFLIRNIYFSINELAWAIWHAKHSNYRQLFNWL